MSSPFGNSLSSGVQDVAAILPLLGTTQCERHVSLSLQHGYLYAAAAPLSIFGSLGIALAAFWIGIAGTASGARWLKDAGFQPASNIAKMITLDDEQYLAETTLMTALDGLPTQGLQSRGVHLQIRFKDGVSQWNSYLTFSSLIGAGISLIPYLHFIIVHDTSRLSLAWIFPVMRAMGGSCCVIGGQQLLQSRILTIIQQRLDFMDINQFLEKQEIDITTMSIRPREGYISQLWNWRATPKKVPIQWSYNKTSEACLQDLYRYLDLFEGTADEDLEKLLRHISGLPNQFTAERFHNRYRELFPWRGGHNGEKPNSTTAEPFPKKYASRQGVCRILILIGVLGSLVGYIGCFSLVQDEKASPRGRYLWIGLEVFLAIVRTMIWASNPSFDDLHGFQLWHKLSDSSPRHSIEALANSIPTELADLGATPKASAHPRITLPIIEKEAFYGAFIKHSGFLPPLKAGSIVEVPYYAILEGRFCIAFEIELDQYRSWSKRRDVSLMYPWLPPNPKDVFLLDSRSSYIYPRTTPFTLYHVDEPTKTPNTLIANLKVEPMHAFPINYALLQELSVHCDFINSVLDNRPNDLMLQSGHSFDVGWLVNVKYFLSSSKDPDETLGWRPVRNCAEKLMENPQDDAVTSKLIYSGNQALYFYHEKLRGSYEDGTRDDAQASIHYFNQYIKVYSNHPKDIKLQPALMNDLYQKESKKYTEGVNRVDTLLFSWKYWHWYRLNTPSTDYAFDLDAEKVKNLAYKIWNTALYDAIAGEKGHEDVKKHCRKLPEDPTLEVGAPAPEVTTGPPTDVPSEGRSFIARNFCDCTGFKSSKLEDIEAASVRPSTSEKSSTL